MFSLSLSSLISDSLLCSGVQPVTADSPPPVTITRRASNLGMVQVEDDDMDIVEDDKQDAASYE